MNEQSTVSASHPADVQRALRSLAFAAVIIGVLVLAAAAFVLSYPGIHAIALAAGVSPALARLYPVIFDAMLIIAAAAVLSLRTASVATRCYAWLCMLLLLFAAAGADALHATGNSLPHQVAAATVAIIPWALVLLGFGLLLAMLRHARLHRALPAQARADAAPRIAAPATAALPVPVPPAAARPTEAPTTAGPPAGESKQGARQSDPPTGQNGRVDSAPRGFDALFSRDSAPAPDAPAVTTPPPSASEPSVMPAADHADKIEDSQEAELALDAEPGHDDPTSDEAHSASHPAARLMPGADEKKQPDADGNHVRDDPAPTAAAASADGSIPGQQAVPEPELEPAATLQSEHESAPASKAEPEPAPEPEPGHQPDPGQQPEPLPTPVAPFERMWSSPTPPVA